MNNVSELLDQFEDFELAFFCKYKLDTYLEETQNKIRAYLKQRNMDETKIKRLIEKYSHYSFSDNEMRCPRCKSKKLTIDYGEPFDASSTNYNLTMELIDYEDATNRNVTFSCIVCGLSFSPPRRYSFMRKILNFILLFIIPIRYPSK